MYELMEIARCNFGSVLAHAVAPQISLSKKSSAIWRHQMLRLGVLEIEACVPSLTLTNAHVIDAADMPEQICAPAYS